MATLKDIASLMPIVTAAVAVFFGFLAWRFNERSIRRQARQDHIRMIIEINRFLLNTQSCTASFPVNTQRRQSLLKTDR
jgi:hypothetical protein